MENKQGIDSLVADRLTPAQASEILGISEYTFREKIRQNKAFVPYYRIGKRIFIRKSQLLKWIEEQEKKSLIS